MQRFTAKVSTHLKSKTKQPAAFRGWAVETRMHSGSCSHLLARSRALSPARGAASHWYQLSLDRKLTPFPLLESLVKLTGFTNKSEGPF